MVRYTLRLIYDSEKIQLTISNRITMPELPRIGEDVFFGTFEGGGDYVEVEHVWHHPYKKEIHVDCILSTKTNMLWLFVETWRSMSGWKISEGDKKNIRNFKERLRRRNKSKPKT